MPEHAAACADRVIQLHRLITRIPNSMTNQRNKSLIACWVLAFAGLMFVSLSNAASFPCEKARSAIEKSICGSTEVSELDEYMGRYFAGAKMHLRHAESCLVNDQKTWLRKVRDQCRDAECLKRVYLDRLAILHAVQPGATSLRHMTLPKLPPLVWIVPPASDEVAAPRSQPTNPLSARGKIVDDVATGDGYVLQSDAGEKYLIVPSMLLEGPTADALATLARLPNATYVIHGRTDSKGTNATAFVSGQCAFVYRTTP
jgi:uncharacterized protein